MRIYILAAALAAAVFATPSEAQKLAALPAQQPAYPYTLAMQDDDAPMPPAPVVAQVSLAKQEMVVTLHGIEIHRWKVSTARAGYITPKGTFRGQTMHRQHYSSLFNNAPMPFSIFYNGHYAIHGTVAVRHLGRPASAGCVRLHPDNARVLFGIVQKYGASGLKVVVDG